MDKASRSCFVQSPEHCLIEKYIRVARLHRSMMERRLDGTGVYRSQHQILMFVSDNPNVSQNTKALWAPKITNTHHMPPMKPPHKTGLIPIRPV